MNYINYSSSRLCIMKQGVYVIAYDLNNRDTHCLIAYYIQKHTNDDR